MKSHQGIQQEKHHPKLENVKPHSMNNHWKLFSPAQ